jgi:hypothetical protein
LDAIVANGLIDDIESLTRDRGYDPVVRARLARYWLTELEIQKRGTKPSNGTTPPGSLSGCDGSSQPPTRGDRTATGAVMADATGLRCVVE